MSHFLCEGDIMFWVGEVIGAVGNLMIDIEAAAFATTIMFLQEVIFDRKKFWATEASTGSTSGGIVKPTTERVGGRSV